MDERSARALAAGKVLHGVAWSAAAKVENLEISSVENLEL
jgi:hypothetical protein